MAAPVNIKLSAKQKRKIRVVSMADRRGGAAIPKGEHRYYKITFDHLTQERAEREKLLADGEVESEESKKTAVYAYVVIEKSLIVDVGLTSDRNPKTFAQVNTIIEPVEENAETNNGQSST